MQNLLAVLVAWAVSTSMAQTLFAQETMDNDTDSAAVHVTYGDKGVEFRTADGRYLVQIQSRLQFRFAAPYDSDPVTNDDFGRDNQSVFKVNRARLKVGGHGFEEWVAFYWEYELASANLLDFRFMITKVPTLKLKVGQWKVQYGRERVISSGKQQMADRSLINRPFTLDRQQGVSVYGRLRGNGAVDVSYWVSVFTGTGRGNKNNDDAHMMWMTRLQWNFLGRVPAILGSDIDHHDPAVGSIAVGATTNRSPYTRFSQDGGGQLDGFGPGDPGQFRVNQLLGETAYMHRGFSWQQEFHWKQIDDANNGSRTTMIGNYAQLGYFFSGVWENFPRPLEFALRHAFYNPDTHQDSDLQHELSLVANWFFKGHKNKLTAEISFFDFEDVPGAGRDDTRFRLQWDVSI